MQLNSKNTLLRISLLVVLLVVAGVVIIAINSLRKNQVMVDSFFESQSASTSGKIVKIDGNLITIENTAGQTKQFKAVENLMVSDQTSGISQPNNKPAVGRKVTINFQTINGEYQVIGLSYMPEGGVSPRPTGVPDANYEKERAKFIPPVGLAPTPASASSRPRATNK